MIKREFIALDVKSAKNKKKIFGIYQEAKKVYKERGLGSVYWARILLDAMICFKNNGFKVK